MGYSLKLQLGFDLAAHNTLSSFTPSDDPFVTYFSDGTPRDRLSAFTWTVENRLGEQIRMCFGTLYSKNRSELALVNIAFLKTIVLTEMFGATSYGLDHLRSNWLFLCRLWLLSTSKNIPLNTLHLFPNVIDEWIDDQDSGNVLRLLAICERLSIRVDEIGIRLISAQQISRIRQRVGTSESRQTPCIPTRMHDVLLDRCHNVVTEFLEESDNFYALLRDSHHAALSPAHRRQRFKEIAAKYPVVSAQLLSSGRTLRMPAEVIGHLNLDRKSVV